MIPAELGARRTPIGDRINASLASTILRGPVEPLRAIEWLSLVVFVVAVAVVTSFQAPLNAPFTDLFHEGEYLAPRLILESGGQPLLIHGLMNYVPSLLAVHMCGIDRVLACTRAVNAGVTVLAAVGFASCTFILARTRKAMVFAGLGMFTILVLINGRAAGPVALQQGSPSARDVALMAVLSCILAVPGRRQAVSNFLAGSAGLIAGASLFWAYNRGVIGVAIIPLYSLSSLLVGRVRWHVLAPLAGLAVGLLIVGLAEPEMWRQHIFNINYWAQNGQIWRYPFSVPRLLLNLPFYLVSAGVLIWAAWMAWHLWRDLERRGDLPSLLVLMAINLLVVQQVSNRDDATHLMWAIPWLFLLVVQLINFQGFALVTNVSWTNVAKNHSALLVSFAGLLCLDLASSTSVVRREMLDSTKNILLLTRGMPLDLDLTPPATRRIVEILRKTGQTCTYAFNNAGGYYHLAGQRPCSTTMYPVYASRDVEEHLIAELSKAKPAMVIGRSDDWFSSMNGKTLAARTPRLAAWLDHNYPHSIQLGGTEMRMLRKSAVRPRFHTSYLLIPQK